MNQREIYLAGGCFWGTEAYLKRIPGVLETEVGYANSAVADPSYEEVCSGETGAAEAVRVTYDADVLPLPLLGGTGRWTAHPPARSRHTAR